MALILHSRPDVAPAPHAHEGADAALKQAQSCVETMAHEALHSHTADRRRLPEILGSIEKQAGLLVRVLSKDSGETSRASPELSRALRPLFLISVASDDGSRKLSDFFSIDDMRHMQSLVDTGDGLAIKSLVTKTQIASSDPEILREVQAEAEALKRVTPNPLFQARLAKLSASILKDLAELEARADAVDVGPARAPKSKTAEAPSAPQKGIAPESGRGEGVAAGGLRRRNALGAGQGRQQGERIAARAALGAKEPNAGGEGHVPGRAPPLRPKLDLEAAPKVPPRPPRPAGVRLQPQRQPVPIRGPQPGHQGGALAFPAAQPAARGMVSAGHMGPRPAQTQSPVVRPTYAVHMGVKQKYHPSAYQHLGFGKKQKFSRLTSAINPRVTGILTSTQFRGSFGKMSHLFTPYGESFVVKTMRTRRKEGRSPNNPHREYTHAMSRLSIVEEAEVTQWVHKVVEADAAEYDAKTVPENNALAATRKKSTPTEILDLIEVPGTGKIAMVMTRETGDLQHLHDGLPSDLRAALALSVAVQATSAAAAVHKAGVAHMDFKLENCTFNADGQIKIVDWGLMQRIDNRGATADTRGRIGTLLAPEMVNVTDPSSDRRARLTAAVDVFSIAVSVVQAAGSPEFEHPFYWPRSRRLDNDRQLRDAAAAKTMQEFETWRMGLRGPNQGRIDANLIYEDSIFGAFFAPLARANPELCSVLLNEAMSIDPTQRATAAELTPHLHALMLKPENKAAVARLQDHMLQTDLTNNVEPLRQAANSYARWEEGPELQQSLAAAAARARANRAKYLDGFV